MTACKLQEIAAEMYDQFPEASKVLFDKSTWIIAYGFGYLDAMNSKTSK